MPEATINAFDAERFAALIARFDTSNPSEAEAMNAARALRRMLSDHQLRLVDAMARTDAMQALDALLQPVREDSAELKEAFLQVAKYAELARELAERVSDLRQKIATGGGEQVRRGGPISGVLAALVLLASLTLMLLAEYH